MLKVFRERMKDDKGFTLIELMVVVLIIAILLAIAIPTFLRVRRNAQDRAAQSAVQTGMKAEKAFYVDGNNNMYTTSATELESVESSLNYHGTVGSTCALGGANPSDGTNCVKVAIGADNQTIFVIGLSKTGKYWVMKDVANAGTFYGTGDTEDAAKTAATAGEW